MESEAGRQQRIEFRLLGPLEVQLDGQRQHLGGGRQEKLLATFLLASSNLLTTGTLIDELWEDDPPKTARRQVHNAVAALRRSLGAARSVVITDGSNYRVNVPDEQVDIHRFSQACDSARQMTDRAQAIRTLRAALGMWRGSALAGLTGRTVEAAATRLEEQRLDALELLTDLRLADGEAAALIPELTELTGRHALRERLRYQLILALYRCGRQPEALDVYDQTRTLLAGELGVDPSPSLRRLHERILRGDPGLDQPAEAGAALAHTEQTSARPCVLPHDIADFTGRHNEVERLLTMANSADKTALVITAVDGMAGIGKTTLAVRVAHLLADGYRDGQLFVDLHGHTPGERPLDPGAALDLLLRSLGVPPEQIPPDRETKVARWRSELADRRVMVVLDNAESSAQVRPLLPGSPGARVLVTSRRRLSTLDGSASFSLDLMPRTEAVSLFHRVAGAERAAREPDQVDEVVALCGYLPLAIRISASRFHNRPMWTVGYLAERLRDERRRLAELSTPDRSVLAAFSVSYQHLTSAQQQLYRLLGLHPGPDFDAYAAAALTGSPIGEVEQLLEDLLDVHLLSQHKVGRYHFHDLVRQHARTTAEQDEPAAAKQDAITRLADHYLNLSQTGEQLIDPAFQPTGTGHRHPAALPAMRTVADVKEMLTAEHQNFSAIVGAASHDLPGLASRLPLGLGPPLLRNGYIEDALAAYDHGLTAARKTSDATAESTLLRNLGVAYLGIGRFADAAESLHAGLAVVRKLDDRDDEARIRRHIATVHIRLGQYDEALDQLRQCLDLLSSTATSFDQASVLANLGVVLTKLGRYEEAAGYHSQALAMVSGQENRYAEAMGLLNVGWTYTLLGDLEAGRRHLCSALSLSRQIGAKEAESRSLYILADCLRRQGSVTEALEHCRSSLVLARETRDRDVEGQALNVLGQIHYAMADLESSADCFGHALRLIEDSGQTYKAAQSYDGLGKIAAAKGDQIAAVANWKKALIIATDAGLPEREEIALRLTTAGTY
jgi:DNA-binding SARP family transcriptional activator/tetratricopeptide (TPR) repeat protein